MRTFAALALALSLSTQIAQAAPRKASSSEVKAATTAAAKARDELKHAKSAAKLAAHRVKLAKAKASALKSRQRLAHEQWIADCIHERTGPTDGITAEEAADICTAEAPDGNELVDE
jgi:hypothetical protein